MDKVLGENFLAPLHRHFINLMCVDSGDEAKRQFNGQPALYNFSAFVVEIDGRWFGITAGHIFNELKKATENGAQLSNWQIDDSIVSSNPQQPYLIPLNIDNDVILFNKDGMDYACFEICPLARLALAKEGITAIPQSVWNADDVDKYSLWLLVGTPYGLSKLALGKNKKLDKLHATVRLKPIVPEDYPCEKTPYKRIYAKIDFSSVVGGENGFDIGGMSGGPVFGILPSTESCEYNYRVIGIQSAWDGKDCAALCAAPPFILAIAQLIGKQPPAPAEADSNTQ